MRTAQNTETIKKDTLSIPKEFKEVIGVWYYNINGMFCEEEFYKNKKDNKFYVYGTYATNINGYEKSEGLEELTRIKVKKGYEYHYKNGGYNDEYFLIDNNMNLSAINKEGKVFAKGVKVEK
jgi:hypothetical protein